MAIEVTLERDRPDGAVLGVPVRPGEPLEAGALPEDLRGWLADQGFEAKAGDSRTVRGADGTTYVALGMGEQPDLDAFRQAGANLVRAASRAEVAATTLLDAAGEELDRADVARAVAEGAVLADYRFDRFKGETKPGRLARLAVVGSGGKRVQGALDTGVRVGEGVCLARDLVNTPAGSLSPRDFAQIAVEVAEREDLQVSVLDEDDAAEAGLGGLLGVAAGSEQPPRLVELTFEPAKRARGTVALVGKGITFDSGGLSIKSSQGMMSMKGDMGGAGAILGAMAAVRAVDPAVRVHAFLPLTENMPGGRATRPGDVLQIRNGKTVEVLNTDAEGRLVLADALSLAVEAEPDAIVDLATLTGACITALGPQIAGLMGTSGSLCDQVEAASARTAERVWRLPLPDDYRKRLDSDVADVKNIAQSGGAGTIIAGLFLREFVGDAPWAHLDIAGKEFSDEDSGYVRKGATGYGVRLLLDLLANYRKPRD